MRIGEVFYRWWRCEREMRHTIALLTRAGVPRNDPLYLLSVELAAVPARMKRIVVAQVILIGAVSLLALSVQMVEDDSLIVKETSKGYLLVAEGVVTVKTVPCAAQVQCVELIRQAAR